MMSDLEVLWLIRDEYIGLSVLYISSSEKSNVYTHILGYDIQRLIADLNGVTAFVVLHIPLDCPS